MFTKAWLKKIQYNVQWLKVNSHIQEKLSEDPKRVLQGDKLAWQIIEEADRLAGIMHKEASTDQEAVFFSDSKVMVSIWDPDSWVNIWQS